MMLAPLLLLGQTPDFATDPRLDRPVAMNEQVAPLSKVVEDFSKATSVPLYVESHVREDLVVLITRSRPARESMERLAKHFGWRWVPASNGGYRVEPTEEFMRKARGGQPLEQLPQLRQARAFAQSMVPKLERLTPAQISQAKAALEKETGEEDQGQDEHRELGLITDPLSLPVCRLIANLTDDQMFGTFERRMVVSTDPGTFAYGMSDRLKADSWQCVRTLAVQMAADFKAAPDDNLAPFDPSKVSEIRYQVQEGANVNVTLLGPKRSILFRTNFSLKLPTPSNKFTLPQDIQDEIGRIKPTANPDGTGKGREPLVPFAEVLGRVAKKLNVDVVGDAYDAYVGLTLGEESTVQRWANRCAIASDAGWLGCRSRHWPTMRARTIPRSVWYRLEGRSPQRLTLAERATLASLLDFPQSRSNLLRWGKEDYSFYRFWAATPQSMRQRLFSGEPIPLASLPTQVHDYLFDASVGGQFSFSGVLDDSIFEEPELADGADSETNQEMDKDYATLYPRWISPNAMLSLKSAEVPGIYVDEFEGMIGPSLLAEILTADLTEQDIKEAGQVRLASAVGMAFRFTLAPGLRIDRQESDVTLGKPVPFDPQSWTEEIRKRIEAARERARLKGNGDDGGSAPPPPR